MASAHSLLGLVNQLQSMEQHFTSILLETILKLTSLTDAKVLVLVESPDCRRIAGSEHLCRAFADGQLQPVLSDRLVHLQPEVFALREEPLASTFSDTASPADLDVRVMSVHSANGGGDRIGGSPSSTLWRKRGPSAGFPRHARPSKERRRTPPAFKRDPDPFQPSEFLAPDEASFSLDPNTSDFRAENGGLSADDAETSGVDGSAMDDGGDSFGGGDGGGEDVPVEDDSFAEVLFSKPISLNDGTVVQNNQESRMQGSSSSAAAALASASSPALDDGGFPPTPSLTGESGALVPSTPAFDHDFSFIEDFMRTNHKVGPVLSIYDESVTEKNSVSNKVTLSLVYDFAKCLHSHSPYATFKDWGFREFFEAAFEKFWHNFPNFAVWEASNMRFQERVDKRTNMCRMATPKSFLRQKIRINVINLMLTKHKIANGAGGGGGGGGANKGPKKALPYY